MYLDYWQLETKPFEPGVNRSTFYAGESHQAALLKLRYALESRRSVALLAGPAGIGKTCLVQLVRQEFDDSLGPFAHLVFPQMSARDLLCYFADELGTEAPEAPRYTIDESVRRLEVFLAANVAAGRHAVIVIDEAHLLEDCGVLETVRLLTNLAPGGTPAITVLLVGQPGLLSSVNRLAGLDDRIGVKTVLRAFTAEETACYILHRMNAAGANREVFAPEALEAVHYLSHGIPGQINRLADLALLVGYASGLATISADHVEGVCEELVTVAPE